MSDEGFILDKPDQIAAFALLQIYFKLKTEARLPGGPTWRVSPMRQAQMILREAGRPAGARKKLVLEQYGNLLREMGVLSDAQST